MSKINVMTDKGREIQKQLDIVKEHLYEADATDHGLWLAVNTLYQAIETLLNDDEPCWEKINAGNIETED